MIIHIYIEVHVYERERLHDSVLVPHSKTYGIVGKNIIAPLRKINGKEISITVKDDYSVGELWDCIEGIIYWGNNDSKETLAFVRNYNILEKYLVFDDIRYSVNDDKKPLRYCCQVMGRKDANHVKVQLLVSSDAGTVFEDSGIRYYMNSKEAGSHNKPHVHVNVRNEEEASFSILDGTQLAGGKIKPKDKKEIQNMIAEKRYELLEYWNKHTDGLSVDLNQVWGLIKY